ncbi:MAG: hypothetical protein IPH18_01135 [Chitinophagaceae bacterium]|nr:hypothetical protein [Chitinophagaceae bacterium]
MCKVTVKVKGLIFSTVLMFAYCTGHKNDENGSLKKKMGIPDYIPDSVYSDTANLFSREKAELGRYLFYDKRLSVNNTKSCASCHAPQFSFTDSYRRSVGAFGDFTRHNSPPLVNLVFNNYFTYTDSAIHAPETQINNPMFGIKPVEMGWRGNENEILERIRKDSLYCKLFAKAYPDEGVRITLKNLQYSITTFMKTLISFSSRYDAYMAGNTYAFGENEKKGMQLFESSELKCNLCHSGYNFNRPQLRQAPYFTIGFSGDISQDTLKYKVPTLRNLAFTSPYLNDGSVESLDEVIRLFSKGGMAPNRHQYVSGFTLNLEQRKNLVCFLLSLSDSVFITKPQFQDPWAIK